ncbi:MAG TPA: N-6 DNA methylase [Spirochaetota bacterium]|nr:N-6 DNA methylase [Spirochaetota bacterium]HSA16082.1 N-6 DNA methylase [Spirochaetota bacterium]
MNKIYNESPHIIADRYGQEYARSSRKAHKKEYGQYLTPIEVADFMGGLISKNEKEEITILDPGVGTGVLACSACEHAVLKIKGLKKINIIGYEVDPQIIPYAEKSFAGLSGWLRARNIGSSINIIENDFILGNNDAMDHSEKLFNDKPSHGNIDIVISNPPYFKINKDDPRSKAVSKVVYGQPNIYSLFMIISAFMLKKGGDMIFITPRSYTSGFYFKAFREIFFSEMTPEQFHLFGSRDEAFERDDVLQEHLIIHAKKRHITEAGPNEKVIISHSRSSSDLDKPVKRNALLHDVINHKSGNKFVFLPLSDEEENTISFVNSWPGSLHKFNMEISTGRVVPFRVRQFLAMENDGSCAPLIWMNHIKNAKIEWPIENCRKEQFIAVNDASMPILVPNGNYVIMRRFSPKEDIKRINTAPLYQSRCHHEYLGIENHVNYIHRPGGRLTPEEIAGLSAVLNTKYLDIYFRTLNGNTEVSATEIRDIPLPDYDFILKVGRMILENGLQHIDIDQLFLDEESGAA